MDSHDPERTIGAQAYRHLAESRIKRQPFRLLFILIVAGLSAGFVAPVWGSLVLALIALAEWGERAAARAFLSSCDDPGKNPLGVPRIMLIAWQLATSFTVAAGLATIFYFAEGAQRDLALYAMSAVVLVVAIANNQVLPLLLARQLVYVGTGVAMTFLDAQARYELGIPGASAPLVVASLFAFLVLLLSYRSGRSYREGLKREADLARARDAAQKADRGKGTFLATVSHELRTPLNGMLGMTQTLLQSDLNPEQKAQVEVIAESGKALNALLTDILDFSKLEAGKLSIQPAEDDLRRIIDGLLRLYAPNAENKGLTLSATVLPTVPERLIFDAVRIRQCLSNLLSNAVKFTEAGGVHLQVRSEPGPEAPDGQERSLITVTVKDTGIGIAPDRQPFLFQPFSQADTSISRRFGGTGLGLSITRQLAESMGGTVSLHSVPGEGTEFQLTFLATMAQLPASGAKGRIAANDMSGHRVLVVDDVESNRMVMRLFLQPLGIDVIEAANAEAAFEALEHDNFDAVFLDLHLPGTSGTDIARQLRREDSPHRDLPLIAVTADSSAPIDFMGPGGFDALIRKPVDHRDLQSTLFAATQGRGPNPGT